MCGACVQTEEISGVFKELMNLILNAVLLKPEIFTQKGYQIHCGIGARTFKKGSLKKIHILGGNGIDDEDNKVLLSIDRWDWYPLEKEIRFIVHDETITLVLLEILASQKEFFVKNGLNQKVFIFHNFPCCISSNIVGLNQSFLIAKVSGSEKMLPIQAGIVRNSIPYDKQYSHEEDISTGGINFYEGKSHKNVIDINQVDRAELKLFDCDKFAFSTDLTAIKRYLPELFKLL